MKTPKKKWTLTKFFEEWYVPAATTTLARKRPNEKTIKARRVGIRYWSELMATKKRPKGPKLKEITPEHLLDFWNRLEGMTYRRTPDGCEYPLQPHTRYGRLQDVIIVLAAAGPKSGTSIRAGILETVPRIFIDAPSQFPKETWTLDEFRQVVAAIDRFEPKVDDIERFRLNLKAWIALSYYTGHRATTYQRIVAEDLREIRPGEWVIDIAKSVKTGKPARIPVHSDLLKLLRQLGNSSPLIQFPVVYRTLVEQFKKLQSVAGLEPSRVFSPQAMRRLHCQTLISLGVNQAQELGSGSLGHSSSSVTRAHYGDASSLMLPMMPSVFGHAAETC